MSSHVAIIQLLLDYIKYNLEPIDWKFSSLQEEEKEILKNQQTVNQLRTLCELRDVFSNDSFIDLLKKTQTGWNDGLN